MANDKTDGLDGAELAAVLAELQARLMGSRVRDVALLQGGDDLLLVLSPDREHKAMLHVALGARRARLCLTERRWAKGSFSRGPVAEQLRTALQGAELVGIEQCGTERRCSLRLARDRGALSLEVELFGNRGLWCLVGAGGEVVALSRRARGLQVGGSYEAPGAPGRPAAERPNRFRAPVLEAVDRHFTALDLAAEQDAERQRLAKILGGRRRKLENRLAGLSRQQQEITSVDELRRRADLMLAHGHAVPRGAAAMTVPDPEAPGEVLHFELDPARGVIVQAKALYGRARRLADSAAVAAARRAEAEAELAELTALEEQLAGGSLADVASRLESLKLVPKPKERRRQQPAKKPAEAFRQFVSLEGHGILVGRNNTQNDRLSLRVARGNDLWVHVGGGRAGSHVVVRLPRGKTASLETLLDAGTLAIHFSKYRGSHLCEVLYTQAKHLRKPKGLPPGRVLVNRSKTLRVRLEPERLERLLRSAES